MAKKHKERCKIPCEICGYEIAQERANDARKHKLECTAFSNICVDDICPECGSPDYQRENYEDSGDCIWFPCRCDRCGAKFDNVHKFSHNTGDRIIRGKLEES